MSSTSTPFGASDAASEFRFVIQTKERRETSGRSTAEDAAAFSRFQYVRGNVHTNGVENFWALPQPGLKGTYVSVEPFHLSAYLDEQCFRFNNRKTNDGERFVRALAMTKGCRLTYDKLTRAEQA